MKPRDETEEGEKCDTETIQLRKRNGKRIPTLQRTRKSEVLVDMRGRRTFGEGVGGREEVDKCQYLGVKMGK